MSQFCTYESPMSVGKCGVYTPDGSGRCKRHKNKVSTPKRKKIGDYSGDSKWREDNGYFQAKNGR